MPWVEDCRGGHDCCDMKSPWGPYFAIGVPSWGEDLSGRRRLTELVEVAGGTKGNRLTLVILAEKSRQEILTALAKQEFEVFNLL